MKKVRFREGILLTQGENSAKIQIDMTYDVLKQKEKRHHIPENGCTMQNCIYKQQIYQEAVDKVSAEMSSYLFKLIESTRKNPETVDQLLGLY